MSTGESLKEMRRGRKRPRRGRRATPSLPPRLLEKGKRRLQQRHLQAQMPHVRTLGLRWQWRLCLHLQRTFCLRQQLQPRSRPSLELWNQIRRR